MKYSYKIIFQRFLDLRVGGFLSWILGIVKKKNKNIINKDKIIIYKLSAIGDAILSLPMIKFLKEQTNSEIIVVCSKENKLIFEKQSFIDKLYVFEKKFFKAIKILNILKKENAGLAIDTSHSASTSAILARLTADHTIGFKNYKTASRNKLFDSLIEINPEEHMVYTNLRLLNPLGFNKFSSIQLIPPKYDLNDSKKIKEILGNGKFVGIQPSSRLDYKEWIPEYFAEVIEYIAKRGFKVVLTGAPEEVEKVQKIINLLSAKAKEKIIDLSGKISLKELIALMPLLKLFLCNDGGPMHIAASMNIPVIGIFSVETPKRYAPFNKKSFSISSNLKCNPCIKSYEYKWPKCNNLECLKAITPKIVKEKIDEALDKSF